MNRSGRPGQGVEHRPVAPGIGTAAGMPIRNVACSGTRARGTVTSASALGPPTVEAPVPAPALESGRVTFKHG